MANKKGLIIYFDGPDGVGKSTQLQLAKSDLKDEGREVFTIKAVGGNAFTDILGDALMFNQERPPEADLHIALAAQYAIAKDLIARRNNGEVVLVDRSPLSIVAYQVSGDGMNKQLGYKAAEDLLDIMKPDAVIVYSADDNASLERRGHRNGDAETDHFESKPQEYHQRVAQGFLDAAGKFNATVIDANGPVDAVHKTTMDVITKLQA